MADGNHSLRRLVLERTRDRSKWPADLPPLATEVRAWLAWRDDPDDFHYVDVPEHGTCELLSLRRAATATRKLADELPGMVAILDDQFVCDSRGRVYRTTWNDSGSMRLAELLDTDLAGLVERIAAGYEANRRSPWRAMRIAEDPAAIWVPLRKLTGLDAAPRGAAVAWSVQHERRRRSWFAVNDGARWATSMIVAGDLDPSDAVSQMRSAFADGSLEDHDDAGLVAEIERTRAENTRPFQTLRGSVRIWRQPPMTELLARLARVSLPLRFSAGTRDLDALRAAVGQELPEDLCALYAFANGSETAIFQRYHLEPIAAVLATMHDFAKLAIPHWHRSFVPFLDARNGDAIYVDVAGVHGPAGSVIDFDHEHPDVRAVRYESVHQWLECLVTGIESGLYEWADAAVFPRGFLDTLDLDEIRRHDASITNGRYPWTRRLG